MYWFGVGYDIWDLEESYLVVYVLFRPHEADNLDALCHDVPHMLVFHAEAFVSSCVGMSAVAAKHILPLLNTSRVAACSASCGVVQREGIDGDS